VLELNQEVEVKLIEIDKMGRVNLSLIYEGMDEPGTSLRQDRGGDRGRGGGGRGHDRDRSRGPRHDRDRHRD